MWLRVQPKIEDLKNRIGKMQWLLRVFGDLVFDRLGPVQNSDSVKFEGMMNDWRCVRGGMAW